MIPMPVTPHTLSRLKQAAVEAAAGPWSFERSKTGYYNVLDYYDKPVCASLPKGMIWAPRMPAVWTPNK